MLSKDGDGLDSDDEETTSDSVYEFDEENARIVEKKNVSKLTPTQIYSHLCERIVSKEDKIAIEQGENLEATHADKLAEDIDPLWVFLLLPDCFPNGQGLHKRKYRLKDDFLI